MFKWVLRHHAASITISDDDEHTLIVPFILSMHLQDCEQLDSATKY
jgi:hypothetical protein